MSGNLNFISYLRVSTQRQGRSGLGLEAQRQAVAELAAVVGSLVAPDAVVVDLRVVQDALLHPELNPDTRPVHPDVGLWDEVPEGKAPKSAVPPEPRA